MPNKKRVEITPEEEIEYRRSHMDADEFHTWLKTMVSESIRAQFYLEEKRDEDSPPVVVTEMLAVVGFEWVEDCGCRGGDVRFVLPDGGVPMWKADGLLSAAQRRIDLQQADVEVDVGGDDVG